ncbi:MAG: hypothetical protein LBQ13_03000 [Endomicrobium sp.]|jgi:hypothetical protein|nr:hypothetical protein [Endomicrobium sp.]
MGSENAITLAKNYLKVLEIPFFAFCFTTTTQSSLQKIENDLAISVFSSIVFQNLVIKNNIIGTFDIKK